LVAIIRGARDVATVHGFCSRYERLLQQYSSIICIYSTTKFPERFSYPVLPLRPPPLYFLRLRKKNKRKTNVELARELDFSSTAAAAAAVAGMKISCTSIIETFPRFLHYSPFFLARSLLYRSPVTRPRVIFFINHWRKTDSYDVAGPSNKNSTLSSDFAHDLNYDQRTIFTDEVCHLSSFLFKN
jgi:hypothetical protein